MKFPIQRFTVSGNSMLPALKPGQDVLIWCWFNKLKKEDLIGIKHHNKAIIKRIKKIDNNKYFVEGDNDKESTDSRTFGSVLRQQIVGKVIFVR